MKVTSTVLFAALALSPAVVKAQRLVCAEPGLVVISQQAIAEEARTYFLVQLPRGITQPQADAVAEKCRFGSKIPILASLQTEREWKNVKSRFGSKLKGVPNVEHAWVWARTARDGYVRWSDGTAINLKAWGAWAPGEPGSHSDDNAVAFHAEYPGFFNALHSTDKLTRIMLELR